MPKYSRKEAKNHRLTVINAKDKKAFAAVSATCHFTKDGLQSISGISNNRFRTYVETGLITQVSDPRHPDVYQTTPKGRDYIRDHTGCLGYHSNGIRHDLALFEVYRDLSDEERDTWMNEKDLAYEFGESNQSRSVCDGGYYTSEGELVVIEIITSNYTQEDIERHAQYANDIGGSFNAIEI